MAKTKLSRCMHNFMLIKRNKNEKRYNALLLFTNCFFNLIHFLKIDILCFKTSKLIGKKIDSHHMEKMFPEIQKLFWKTGRSQPKDSKQK